MREAELYTGQTKSGGFKAFILGRVPKFGNERMLTVKDQPHRGYERRDLAAKHALDRFPDAEALTAWAAKAKDNGQFISEAKKKDLLLEPVTFAGGSTPTGPTMPLADRVPPTKAPRGKREGPDSEAKIVKDATAQLQAEPGLTGQLRASLTVAERTAKLAQKKGKGRRTEPPAAPPPQVAAAVVLDDAQEEQALRKFSAASEVMSKYLRHERRIKLLLAERDALMAELVAIFGSEALARAMVERASGVVGAWNTTAAAKS